MAVMGKGTAIQLYRHIFDVKLRIIYNTRTPAPCGGSNMYMELVIWQVHGRHGEKYEYTIYIEIILLY